MTWQLLSLIALFPAAKIRQVSSSSYKRNTDMPNKNFRKLQDAMKTIEYMLRRKLVTLDVKNLDVKTKGSVENPQGPCRQQKQLSML